jgi:DNA polymerase-3 subunit gamma/tau
MQKLMTNLVLYRKYRPQAFADVVSQEHVKTTLKNAVANNRAGHAYLFTGPRGVGKTTIARIFARAVNCPNVKDGEPCNTCDICKEFLNGTSLDVLEIDAASHTGVDNIRELIEHLQFAPTRAKFKVIIIDEVHMLSKGAFNALLKTLEEPPAHAIFVLATTEIHKVPATIVSRTQRFDFKKASVADLVQRLSYVCKDNKVEASSDALVVIATAAEGSFRDGLSLLDQVFNYTSDKLEASLVEEVLGLTSFKTTSEFLNLILDGKNKEAVNFVSQLMYAGKDLSQFHKDFLEYLRKVLIVKVGASVDFGFSSDMQKQIQELADRVALEKLIKLVEIFQKAGSELKWSSIQSLPLELAVVESINIISSSLPRPEALVESAKATTPTHTEAVRSGMQSNLNEDRHVPPSANNQINVGGTREGQGDLDLIKEFWPKILDKLKDYNHSLIPSLKLAQPVAVQGRDLILTFPYKFHKDAVEQRKNRIVVDQVIEEVTGMKLMIKPVVEKDWQSGNINSEPEPAAKSGTDPNLIESALKIIGGEVENQG